MRWRSRARLGLGQPADEEAQTVFLTRSFEDPSRTSDEDVRRLAMKAYNVPSIFTPCRCAAAVHPEGGMVTR